MAQPPHVPSVRQGNILMELNVSLVPETASPVLVPLLARNVIRDLLSLPLELAEDAPSLVLLVKLLISWPALPVERVWSCQDPNVFNVLKIVWNAIVAVARPVSLDILRTLQVSASLIASFPVPLASISSLLHASHASLQPLSVQEPA